MGNNFSVLSDKSVQTKKHHFKEVMDCISTNYILTMDFKSLTKIADESYCSKLIILTTDVLQKYFDETEISYLSQRVENGAQTDDGMSTEKVSYISKDKLLNLDKTSGDKEKKRNMCKGIAFFYIKIAQVFAAIMKTINPVYQHENEYRQRITSSLYERDNIPSGISREISKLNLCDRRVKALEGEKMYDSVSQNITIKPGICDLNTKNNKYLLDEPGIPELEKLYYDKYNYDKGDFTKMSKKSANQYKKDLAKAFASFTDNPQMPEEIQSFKDIKLRHFYNLCNSESASLKKSYTGKQDSDLFRQYAQNIKQMISNATNNQYKLLKVIDALFSYSIEPFTKKRIIRINPTLTSKLLDETVDETKKLILGLYIECEKDYVAGVKIYEALVQDQILKNTSNQISNLKQQSAKLSDKYTYMQRPRYAPDYDSDDSDDLYQSYKSYKR